MRSVNQIAAVVVRITIHIESTSLNEHIDGELASIRCRRGRKDINKETVFRPLAAELCLEVALGADTKRAELCIHH